MSSRAGPSSRPKAKQSGNSAQRALEIKAKLEEAHKIDQMKKEQKKLEEMARQKEAKQRAYELQQSQVKALKMAEAKKRQLALEKHQAVLKDSKLTAEKMKLKEAARLAEAKRQDKLVQEKKKNLKMNRLGGVGPSSSSSRSSTKPTQKSGRSVPAAFSSSKPSNPNTPLPVPLSRQMSVDDDDEVADATRASAEVKRIAPSLQKMISSGNKKLRVKGLQQLAMMSKDTSANDDMLLMSLCRNDLCAAAMGTAPDERGPAMMSLYHASMVPESKMTLAKVPGFLQALVRTVAASGDRVAGGILNNLCTESDVRAMVMQQGGGLEVLHKIAMEGLPVSRKAVSGPWVAK